MHCSSALTALLLGASSVAALQNPHRKGLQRAKREAVKQVKRSSSPSHHNSTYLTAKTEKFAVNGSAIPQINFDVGESYAGTLPINGNASNENQLWFWFFPSENPAASDEIVIWLNGGPGCSSLDGLFQENGPFQWQSGTYEPQPNPYSWTNLTNMIWIDQPVGTGYSPAAKGFPATIMNEEQVAKQFMGFWKNFMETFDLQGRKVYITGESYAGQYIPYISYYMLEANNTEFYNVKGIQINDPSINEDDTMIYAPAVGALLENSVIFGLNDTFMKHIEERNQACGFADFMTKSLVFPPSNGILPTAPNSSEPDCDTWDQIVTAAAYINPCFNWYHIIDFCPYLWDELGFPSLAPGPNNYFNQADVKRALHAPKVDYEICGDDTLFPKGDLSIPSGLGPLPKVIEKTNNVIIGHGLLDYLLLANGSLITIQNMTWNGLQGFQEAPCATNNFYVPYHAGQLEYIEAIDSLPPMVQPLLAGAGLLGTTHTERGLTFVTVDHAGHEIPQYVPGASYRQLEFLLGRIPSLTYVSDFTTQTGNYTGTSNSTVL